MSYISSQRRAKKDIKAETADLRGCDGSTRIIRDDLSHPRKSTVPSVPDLARSDLEAPAFAVFALQILVGVGDVRDLALLAVVVDALALTGLHGHDAEEHRFGQAAGVFEGAGSLLLALNGVDPVHPVLRLRVRPVLVLLDAEVGLRNFAGTCLHGS